MSTLFISHASLDRSFALRLAQSLEKLDYTVWIDVRSIRVGESIPHMIDKALEQADYLIVVLSKHSALSIWSEREWQAKLWEEVSSRRTLVLPAILEDCSLPLLLRTKRYADFRSDFAVGLAQLAIGLHECASITTAHEAIGCNRTTLKDVDSGPRSLSLVSPAVPFCYHGTMKQLGQLAEFNVAIEIPYIGKIAGVWRPDEREQDAAWAMYIELVTRISVAELQPEDGLLRESLSSLYSIFTTTRQILRDYGPAVARPKEQGQLSFGYIAVSILNFVLRPVLAKWHPLLLDYEHQKEQSVSQLKHEQVWERGPELRRDIERTRSVLLECTKLLAQISRIPSMVIE